MNKKIKEILEEGLSLVKQQFDITPEIAYKRGFEDGRQAMQQDMLDHKNELEQQRHFNHKLVMACHKLRKELRILNEELDYLNE